MLDDSGLIAAASRSAIQALAKEFADSPLRLARTCDFLVPERAHALASDLSARQDFADVCGLQPDSEEKWDKTQGRHVSVDEFNQASPQERYFRLMSTRTWSYSIGQDRLDLGCPLELAELAELLDYSTAVTALPLMMIRLLPRRFLPGHFVGSHREGRLGRLATGYLFLSPHWSSDDGGGLELLDDGGQTHWIAPEFNSFALFDVGGHWMQSFCPVVGSQPLHLLQYWLYA